MHVNELVKKHFDIYSVWIWDNKNKGHVSYGDGKPLPEDQGTLFIKSQFRCPNGLSFDGYLTGIDTFYAFGLFYGEAEYVFNLNSSVEHLKVCF
ncbi:hypothetical protein MNBD_GAMMA10-85 [hydrothermal vent metagenome]|uniref:Uncharacterized protein n=1 Tax=hydrothermal vent metagenome TaxID=652676 RepID=A0A3B0YK45_9ZZZZ